MKRFMSFAAIIFILVLLFAACNDSGWPHDVSTSANDTEQSDAKDTSAEKPSDIVFADNGRVLYTFVRPFSTTAVESEQFMLLRREIGDLFGTSIEQSSDAQYAGNIYDKDKAEVLVGSVEYPEVKTLRSKITYNEYAIAVVGKKIVITSGIDTGLPSAVAAFIDYVKANTQYGTLSLPADLYITGKSSAEALKQFDGVPYYPGGNVDAISDCADGFMQLTISETTKEMFAEYRTRMTEAGFELYSENNINDNLFATYTKSSQTVYAYYTPCSGETRVIAAEDAVLPAKEAPEYTKVTEPSVTMFGLEIGGDSGGLGVLIQFEDGSFAIIDGGHSKDIEAKEIYNKLLELAPDPKKITIRAWILTHAHGDHHGAFVKFTSLYSKDSRFTVESFIYNLCDTKEQTQYLEGSGGFATIRKTVKNNYPKATVYKALTGQVYRFPGSDMEVLTCMSDFLPNIIGTELPDADKTKGDGNIQSIIVRFNVGGQSVMITGDAARVNIDQMCKRFGDYLKSDIMTVPHHGWNQNRYRARNGTIEFYTYVNPSIVLWPDSVGAQASKLKWNGTPGSDWEANYYLMNKLNVKRCFVAGKTTVTLKLPYKG